MLKLDVGRVIVVQGREHQSIAEWGAAEAGSCL